MSEPTITFPKKVFFERMTDSVAIVLVGDDADDRRTIILDRSQMLELGTRLRGIATHPERAAETFIDWSTNLPKPKVVKGS